MPGLREEERADAMMIVLAAVWLLLAVCGVSCCMLASMISRREGE